MSFFRPRRIIILALIFAGTIFYFSGLHLPSSETNVDKLIPNHSLLPKKEASVKTPIPTSSLSGRYWERTGNQEVYDKHWMERLDFNSPELKDNCTAKSPFPPRRIPKIVHYVFGLKSDFDKIGFGMLQYAAVKSAYDNIKPDKIIWHYRHLPPDSNIWWARAKPLISTFRYLNEDITEIYGNPVLKIAHKADIVRMRAMMKWGGIYLDLDVIVLKSFDPLLHHEFVMGQEASGEYTGMANALILSHKDSSFLKRWWDQYKTFDGEKWNLHSVRLPYKLSLEYPNELCRLPRISFFYPSYFFNHISFIHEEDEFIFVGPGGFQYAYHVSNHACTKYIGNETIVDVIAKTTSYHRLLQRFLPEDLLREAEIQLHREIKEGKRNENGEIV